MSRKQLLILIAAIVGSSLVFLDGFVVNLALPKISESLHIGFAGQQWIISGYLLTLSSLMLLGGSLGDIFGYKRIYLIGLTGFAISGAICGLVSDPTSLIVMRIIHGAFGALMVPGSLALINIEFKVKDRGRAIGMWTAAAAAVNAIAPVLGGYLVDVTSWRVVFFVCIPFCIISAGFLLWAGKVAQKLQKRSVDWVGAVLGTVGLGGIIFGLIQGPVEHWAARTLVALAIGVISFVLFLLWESRHKDPMLNLRLFRSTNFTAANIVTFALYGALGGLSFILVIYLQEALHYSGLVAGAILLPVAALILLFSTKAGSLASKYGAKWFMTIGPIICGLGMALLYPLHSGSNFWFGVMLPMIIFGIGLAATVAPLTTTVMTSVVESSSGIASAVNNAVSRASGLIVVALLGIMGSAQVFHFSIILCSALAIFSGFLSLLLVRNKVIRARL